MIDGDDAGDPGTAIRQVQRLVQEEQVDVIEGIFFSNILLAVRDTLDSFRKPTVVSNAAANAITRERRSKYVFRTSYTNWQLGAPLARWAAQRVTRQGMVIMAANYAAGQESSAAFRQIYTGGRQGCGRHDLRAVPHGPRLPAVPRPGPRARG
jgi:branched-chain amino acid transport system substrate-binding protein